MDKDQIRKVLAEHLKEQLSELLDMGAIPTDWLIDNDLKGVDLKEVQATIKLVIEDIK